VEQSFPIRIRYTPLFIRSLEWAREDAKSDMALHKFTENALRKRKNTLTMKDYGSLVNKKR
jgi:hypothetical protein